MKGLITVNNRFYKRCKVINLPVQKAAEGSLIRNKTLDCFYIADRSKHGNKIFDEGVGNSSNFISKKFIEPQHLYLICNDEIQTGDWYLHAGNIPVIIKCIDVALINIPNVTKGKCWKIIASTDPELIIDNQIYKFSLEFLEQYCKSEKGIKDVLAEPRILKQGSMVFNQGYKTKNDSIVLKIDDTYNTRKIKVPISLIELILEYCEEQDICNNLVNHGDFYNQLKMMINKEYEF